MRAAGLATVVMLLGAHSPALAAKAVEGPVAVMPFKNLNATLELDWMKVGIAETMISDLQKSGTVEVVERDQIDKALGEILLQADRALGEESAAIKAGKLVGAKTVVLGSFQKAGGKLRINARFVAVETGVVLDTAKTTGTVEQVFALQDQVVDRLLGRKPAPDMPARPARKAEAETVQAYKLYAMALTTASDAERVGYLRKSLELDPDFVYAADELEALEGRLLQYGKKRDEASKALDSARFAAMTDASATPLERTLAANTLLTSRSSERNYVQLLEDARRVLALDVPAPPPGVMSTEDCALFNIYLAYHQLRQVDLAIQAGETYLRRLPGGFWYKQIERGIEALIDERRALENEGRPAIAARFAELATERSKLEAEDPAKPWVGTRLRNVDWERCWFPLQKGDSERAIDECAAFAARYADDPDPAARNLVLESRAKSAYAYANLGRFEKALPIAESIVEDAPESSAAKQMKSYIDSLWPKDAVP